MRLRALSRGVQILLVSLLALGLMRGTLQAQDQGSELKELKKEIQEMRGEFRRALSEKQKKIDRLEQQVRALQAPRKQAQQAQAVEPEPQKVASDQTQQQVQELKEQVEQVVETQKKEVLSVFNPAIGLVGETVFGYRTKGSTATGSDRPGGWDVNQRSVELNLAASIDPFAKGYAVINASADPITGDSTANVEEAALITTSLPWNLTLTAGRFFGEFGRLAYIHDHELPFVNRPLVLDQYIGGESRSDGVQLNYLVPIEHYVSLTLGAGDGLGAAPIDANNFTNGDFRPFGGLTFWGRGSTSFDLTPNLSFEPGVSGIWNPRTLDKGGTIQQPDGTPSSLKERERRVLGGDFVLSYKPLQNNQFQTLTWGTELLFSDNRYDDTNLMPGDPFFSRAIESYGLYSYVAYKFHRQWSAGFLFDWVENAQNNQDQTFAYSPFITWTMSHWSQLRLQYTHTEHNAFSNLRSDDAVYLQWAWIIGSHSHGWQSR